MDTSHSFLTILPALIAGLGMIIFLLISFILFKQRLRTKLRRDEENMDYYITNHPTITPKQYLIKDIPIRNKVKVMTNTHISDIEALFKCETEIDTSNSLQLCMSDRKRKKGARKKRRKSSNADETITNLADECLMQFERRKGDRTNDVKMAKGSKKKRRKFLKCLAKKQNSSIANETNNDKLDHVVKDTVHWHKKDQDVLRSNITLNNSYPFFEDLKQGTSTYIENSYYEEVGLPVQQSTKHKILRKAESMKEPDNIFKIKKADSLRNNALYDRVTCAQEPKKRYKELVHRDSHGNMTHLARRLPNLEDDFSAITEVNIMY